MKRIITTLVITCSVVAATAQTGNWAQTVAKAKAAHRFIFVEVCTAAAGPCRLMDSILADNDTIAGLLRDRFLSVKTDTNQWKVRTYKIKDNPTLLLFDSDGRIVSLLGGLQSPKQFIGAAQAALTSHYYADLAAYLAGKRDYAVMPGLALKAGEIGDKTKADRIALDYIHGYLDKLGESDFLKPANLEFMGQFLRAISSKERIFSLSYTEPAKVDAAVHNPGYARNWVDNIVYREELKPAIMLAGTRRKEPDWTALEAKITAKYNAAISNALVLSARINWYRKQKDAANYGKYLTRQTEEDLQNGRIRYDYLGLWALNNIAWDIFLYDDNAADLDKALSWSRNINAKTEQPDAGDLDTQANLLYKLGHKAEAIKLEQSALAADPKNTDIANDLEKMKQGKKTWPGKMP